jgi:ribosomal protein S21
MMNHQFGFRKPASRQPRRRASMGVKVVVSQGEPLAKALRRLRKLLDREQPRLIRRKPGYYLKPSEVCRRKRNNAKFVARIAESARRREAGIEPLA